MLFLTEEKIARLLPEIQASIYRETVEIPTFRYLEADPAAAQQPDFDDSDWADFHLMDYWGGYDKIAWFRAWVNIPPHFQGKKLALRFLVGPRDGGGSTAETMLYVNGQPLQAIDVWHEEAWLPPEHLRQNRIFIALRSWSSVLNVPDRRRFKLAQLNWIDEGAERLFFLADTLLKAINVMDKNDWRRVNLLTLLNDSFKYIHFTQPRSDEYYESFARAAEFLGDGLRRLEGSEANKPTITAVGHSHIDMAWLWRLGHSREKAGRTFSTVLHLMRQYPEYRFMHSSPQLYKYLQQDYPDIFKKVKARIASGEWEISGGMWIEPDTHLTSGESLIRQILYGKRYIRETFGMESNVVWLPDVFGYSWSLPQIMIKSGITAFMTTKISWSQFNRFPHDTFWWRGVDGSEILTHFITTPESGTKHQYTYNGTLTPHHIIELWNLYQNKALNNELLHAFGWGDGGGGPTREMLEMARVLKDLPGFPRVQTGKVEPYFERLRERLKDKDVPVWDDELYLERHRGTYTSQGQNKRANRKAEILYHDAEWMGALAGILIGEQSSIDLTEGWEMLLLNQFHDILPGSSIRQVYEDSARDYDRITEIGAAALTEALWQITARIRAQQESLAVFNSLPWSRDILVALPYEEAVADKALMLGGGQALPTQTVEQDGERAILVEVPQVPGYGYTTIPVSPVTQTQPNEQYRITVERNRLENQHYRIEVNERGHLTSIYDKLAEREVLAPGGVGNVLQAFEDKPLSADAWDIDVFYQEKMQEVDNLIEAVAEETGPLRGTLRLTWQFYHSTITQRISIYRTSPRIDFRTEIEWREQQVLLKVAFPVNIRATSATYDIQFGSIRRPTHWNTSWDWARFEVPAQKWADLSEGNYGVALLNDCKYGYDIKDNVMRLTLIKSALSPDAQADKGQHVFTYSLLPHVGDCYQGGVIEEGYNLNYPAHTNFIPAQPDGTLPPQLSLLSVEGSGGSVIVETVKRAEDGDGWIVRLYEAKHERHHAVTLRFSQPIRRAAECNLIEEGDAAAQHEGSALTFAIAPFEIKTFRVWF